MKIILFYLCSQFNGLTIDRKSNMLHSDDEHSL